MTDRFVDRRVLSALDISRRYGSTSDMDGLQRLRVAHGTWGIAEGLEVLPLDSGRVLVVTPGVGFDHCGTVMQLSDEAELAPPRPGPHQIVLTDCGVRAVVPNALRGCTRGARAGDRDRRVGGRDHAPLVRCPAEPDVGTPPRERLRACGRRDLHQPPLRPRGRDHHSGRVPDDAAVLLQRRRERSRDRRGHSAVEPTCRQPASRREQPASRAVLHHLRRDADTSPSCSRGRSRAPR